MCILYPLGIPLLFAALMRRERNAMVAKARRRRPRCASPPHAEVLTRGAALGCGLQSQDFLDSYIGFVSAGYSVKVRGARITRKRVGREAPPGVRA